MLTLFKSLCLYRGFVISSIKNDFIARFSRSKLGGLWMVLHPLAQVAIYALILSEVISAKLPGVEGSFGYALYLMSGTLCWAFFSELISRCLTLFIDNGNMMKKVQFPRITLPVIVLGSCGFNNFLLILAVVCVFAVFGNYPTTLYFWLIPLAIVTAIFAMALGLILGVLNVFVRDVGQIVPVVLQMLFWFTPIVYPIDIIPLDFQAILQYNPIYYLVSAYQSVLVYGEPPLLENIGLICLAGIVLGAISLVMFRRAAPEMVDEL